MYAILYEKRLEVFKTESDEPITFITSDVKFISMDFVSETEIVVSDSLGKFTLVRGIENMETTTISLINTKYERYRDIKCYPGTNTLVAITTEGQICFYNVNDMRKFSLEIGSIKPMKAIKSKSRLLCLAINYLPAIEEEKKEKILKKRKKNKKKLSKDEKKLLKRQKKADNKQK